MLMMITITITKTTATSKSVILFVVVSSFVVFVCLLFGLFGLVSFWGFLFCFCCCLLLLFCLLLVFLLFFCQWTNRVISDTFVSDGPAVGTPTQGGCSDKVNNCHLLGSNLCSAYVQFAQINCKKTCNMCGRYTTGEYTAERLERLLVTRQIHFFNRQTHIYTKYSSSSFFVFFLFRISVVVYLESLN